MTRPFGRSEQQARKVALALAANKTVCIMCATEQTAAVYLDRVTRALSGDTTPLRNLTIRVMSLTTVPPEIPDVRMWIEDHDYPYQTPEQRAELADAIKNCRRGFRDDWNYTSMGPTQ